MALSSSASSSCSPSGPAGFQVLKSVESEGKSGTSGRSGKSNWPAKAKVKLPEVAGLGNQQKKNSRVIQKAIRAHSPPPPRSVGTQTDFSCMHGGNGNGWKDDGLAETGFYTPYGVYISTA